MQGSNMICADGFTATAAHGATISNVRVYMPPRACPRCDRPARDAYEWGKWVREALNEYETERIREDLETWPGPGRRDDLNRDSVYRTGAGRVDARITGED